MPHAIIIEAAAKADLADASQYYEKQQEGLGIRFLEEVQEFLSIAAERPRAYAVLHRNVRSVRVPRFPYLILYRFDDTTIYVLGVMHGAQNPQTIRRRGN